MEPLDNLGIFFCESSIEEVPNCTNLPSLSMGFVKKPEWNKAKVEILYPGLNFVKKCFYWHNLGLDLILFYILI